MGPSAAELIKCLLSTAEAVGVLGFAIRCSQWEIIVHIMRFGYDATVTHLCQITFSFDMQPSLLLLFIGKRITIEMHRPKQKPGQSS